MAECGISLFRCTTIFLLYFKTVITSTVQYDLASVRFRHFCRWILHACLFVNNSYVAIVVHNLDGTSVVLSQFVGFTLPTDCTQVLRGGRGGGGARRNDGQPPPAASATATRAAATRGPTAAASRGRGRDRDQRPKWKRGRRRKQQWSRRQCCCYPGEETISSIKNGNGEKVEGKLISSRFSVDVFFGDASSALKLSTFHFFFKP